jgi:regulator of extracellular matrix RemA (YlzA/DUF370 family)
MEGHCRQVQQTDIDSSALKPVLDEAHRTGFTVQSGFARRHAELVACAASLQLITTRIQPGVFSRDWQITAKGLRWLNEMKELD